MKRILALFCMMCILFLSACAPQGEETTDQTPNDGQESNDGITDGAEESTSKQEEEKLPLTAYGMLYFDTVDELTDFLKTASGTEEDFYAFLQQSELAEYSEHYNYYDVRDMILILQESGILVAKQDVEEVVSCIYYTPERGDVDFVYVIDNVRYDVFYADRPTLIEPPRDDDPVEKCDFGPYTMSIYRNHRALKGITYFANAVLSILISSEIDGEEVESSNLTEFFEHRPFQIINSASKP